MRTIDLQPIKMRYGIVGNHEGLNRALDIAVQVAHTDLSVLIEGESGVGKEVIPKIIHDNSPRKHGNYFAINCGSIPEGTIDSELFGHEKGAFTGAIGEREGYFGAANNGTLFLDEVGELPLATQARLLRVLENGEYIRVGSNQVKKTNVRIIAATNVKMQKAISEGKFREDLYYRLATVPVSIPPLRHRGKDIGLLFRKFANEIAEKYRLEPITLSDDAKDLILKYKWPGNIRQLRNLTEQISIISRERLITPDILMSFGVTDDSMSGHSIILANQQNADKESVSEHSYEKERDMLFQVLANLSKDVKELKEMINSNHDAIIQSQPNTIITPTHPHIISSPQQTPHYTSPDGYTIHSNNGAGNIYIQPAASTIAQEMDESEQYVEAIPRTIKEMEQNRISDALTRNHGNRSKAAKELGISERTLYRKIKSYGIEI